MVLLEQIRVQPIGYVKNGLGRRRYNEWRDAKSEIVISEEYQDALYRLNEYSHIEVLFNLHEMNRPFRTRIHPTGNPEYPEMGVLATRTPNRPSRIALTTCRLLGVDGNVLQVKGLDAFNGSPVLDIKPYTKKLLREVRTPDWLNDLNIKISQKGK